MADKKYQIRQVSAKGLGLFARREIQANTVIQSVPQDRFLTYDMVEDFYEFMDILYDRSICSKVLFSYFLASMEIMGSPPHPEYSHVIDYIHELSGAVHGLISWQPRQLYKIRNQKLVEGVIKKQKEVKECFQKIHRSVKQVWRSPAGRGQYRLFENRLQCQKITQHLVIKYYSTIQSRGIYYVWSKSQSTYTGALVPIIDKLNHSNNPNCVVQIRSECLIRSIRKIQAGEEILVSYGNFNTDTFLEFYGFLPQFSQGESPHSPHYRQKIATFYNRNFFIESSSEKIGKESNLDISEKNNSFSI